MKLSYLLIRISGFIPLLIIVPLYVYALIYIQGFLKVYFILIGAGLLIYLLLKSTRLGRKLLLSLNKPLKNLLGQLNQFKGAKGERIIFPAMIVETTGFGLFSLSANPRIVIVTNLRILLCAPSSKRSLNNLNLWKPTLSAIPSMQEPLFGKVELPELTNAQLASMEVNETAPFLLVGFKKFSLPFFSKIYHPKSREIYNLFQQ